ncbi:MAG TPA: hypothetical protein VFV38_15775 [Ktedonobacteraceae bacterium]|nr:hypothetical protein [Ktedonobacteraceae bacterium]
MASILSIFFLKREIYPLSLRNERPASISQHSIPPDPALHEHPEVLSPVLAGIQLKSVLPPHGQWPEVPGYQFQISSRAAF